MTFVGGEIEFYLLLLSIPVIIGLIMIFNHKKDKNKLIGGIILSVIGGLGLFLFILFLVRGPVLPSRCSFTPEFICLEHRVSNDMLSFSVRNLLDSSARFEFIAIDIADETNTICAVSPTTVESGEIIDVICAFDKPFTKGDKVKFEIQGTYTKADTPVSFIGEVYTEVK